MFLVKGNKEFTQWWNHWMSRIHSTPGRANNETSAIGEDVLVPGVLSDAINDEKSNRPKPRSGRRTTIKDVDVHRGWPASYVMTDIPLGKAPYCMGSDRLLIN